MHTESTIIMVSPRSCWESSTRFGGDQPGASVVSRPSQRGADQMQQRSRRLENYRAGVRRLGLSAFSTIGQETITTPLTPREESRSHKSLLSREGRHRTPAG